ncbi:DUF1102 domain-containing protein [Halorubrum sp. ASP1]|uniref:DUF1102 domain-containing protein n=1 Tax=Halorubrum sp. ASP1 TaxID=2518114 RepID=UPI0010F8F8A8|nr:DUF1102 domain-containing protein [Halorubrum sp. ASP1]TKX62968.1 DUF1102 domain-containing protein [Halorubrum sp. ASP1]
MANRRKFITGLGALAAGSAAAVGTGAFTSVSANRDVSVAVADDADALLSIDTVSGAANSEYVDTSGDAASITIESDAGGTGLNDDALTKIKNLLRIKNLGTQDVYVYAKGMPTDPRVALAVQPSSQIQNAGTGSGENQGAFSLNSNLTEDDLDDDEGSGKEEAAPLLAPGDYVDVEMFAYGDLSGLDFDGTISIEAIADNEV